MGLIGKLVASVQDDMFSAYCLCTLDEFLDGHRHHCPMHRICADCVVDWENEESEE